MIVVAYLSVGAPDRSQATILMTEDGILSGSPATPTAHYGYSAAAFLGAKWIRYHRGLDPTQPNYFQAYIDEVEAWLGDVRQRGFEPYLTITYEPGSYQTAPSAQDYGAWCGSIAQHFDGRIKRYSVWNESNLPYQAPTPTNPHPRNTYLTPAAYNSLYRACRTAILSADPTARVYYGEMAPRVNTCDYVTQSLSSSNPTTTDGLAIHTYQWKTLPSQEMPDSDLCQGIGRLGDWNQLNSFWFANGQSLRTPQGTKVPLMITEHGYCAVAMDGECPNVDYDNLLADEHERAEYTRQAFEWAYLNGVAVFNYYHLFNLEPGYTGWDSGIIVRSGVSPSEAFFELKTATGGHGRLPGESDVSGDGAADLVTVTSNGTPYVYPGRFNDTYSSGVSSAITVDPALFDGTGHYAIDVADVNGDLRDDLVTLHSSGTVYTHLGQAGNTFGAPTGSLTGLTPGLLSTGGAYEPIAVADVNGDGRSDLVAFNATTKNVGVWPGQSSGGFGAVAWSFAGSMDSALHDASGHYFIDVTDVTGDGKSDLVTLGSGGTAFVYPGQAGLTFGPYASSFAGTMNPAMDDAVGHEPVGVSDVTGDRRADLVTLANGTVRVYPGQASGSFGLAAASFNGTLDSSLFDGVGHEVIDVMDVNRDGHSDLVTAHTNGQSFLYRGLPNGTFGVPGTTSFAGTFFTTQFDTPGHQPATEKPFWRRRGCSLNGCH